MDQSNLEKVRNKVAEIQSILVEMNDLQKKMNAVSDDHVKLISQITEEETNPFVSDVIQNTDDLVNAISSTKVWEVVKRSSGTYWSACHRFDRIVMRYIPYKESGEILEKDLDVLKPIFDKFCHYPLDYEFTHPKKDEISFRFVSPEVAKLGLWPVEYSTWGRYYQVNRFDQMKYVILNGV